MMKVFGVEPERAPGEVSKLSFVTDAVAPAIEALRGMSGGLHRLNGAELAEAFAAAQELRRLSDAGSVACLSEALERGECGDGGVDPREWVVANRDAGSAPVEPGEVARLVTVAKGVNASPVRKPLRDRVIDGSVSVAKAQVCLGEMKRLEHRLTEHAVPIVWQAFADLASIGTTQEVRGLQPALLAKYGADDELQRDHDKAATFVSLSTPVRDGALFHYALTLDPAGHATLEAAIGPLSAPQPGENGERDTRPVNRRRGEALMEAVTRGVAAAEGVPAIPKTQLLVTMNLADLESRLGRAGVDIFGRGNHANYVAGDHDSTGAGEVIGSTAGGTLLAPGEVRRLACDANVTPVVLGGKGEILEVGRSLRLFPPGMIRALLLRDRECTFPGCTRPGTWADAHHLIHWADDGPTNITNAALLCGRHHARVHSDRLYGWVNAQGQVAWDLAPLSYDRFLEHRENDRRRRNIETDRE